MTLYRDLCCSSPGSWARGARHESGSQGDSTAKRLISKRTCTQGQRAFVGQDGILRPIGNRPFESRQETAQVGYHPTARCHLAPHMRRRFHFYVAHPGAGTPACLTHAPHALPRDSVTDSTIRQPSVAQLACDFCWGHDFLQFVPESATRKCRAAARRQAEACPTSRRDFTDPKGPLLTSDFHTPQGYQGRALASGGVSQNCGGVAGLWH